MGIRNAFLKTLRLLSLTPYSPERNPEEHIWDDWRESEFHNNVSDGIDPIEDHLEKALHKVEDDHEGIRSIVVWPWIINAPMNERWNKKSPLFLLLLDVENRKKGRTLRSSLFINGICRCFPNPASDSPSP